MCDNIILYLAPLVLPGASRFDQLLVLTELLTLAAETHTPHDQAQLSLCVGSLNKFVAADATTQNTPAVRLQLSTSLEPPTAIPSAAPTIPVTQSTRHRPSSDRRRPHPPTSSVGSFNKFLAADATTQNIPAVRLQLPTSLEPPLQYHPPPPRYPSRSLHDTDPVPTGADLIR